MNNIYVYIAVMYVCSAEAVPGVLFIWVAYAKLLSTVIRRNLEGIQKQWELLVSAK